MSDQIEPTQADRFWAKVDRRGPDECWLWRISNGAHRPRFQFEGRSRLASRIVLILVGRPPRDPSLFALHTCDNPRCVNPAHLWWGTNADNMLDAANKKRLIATQKTHCPRGHALEGDNLMRGSPPRRRHCRICHNLLQPERTRRFRAKAIRNLKDQPR